MFVWLTEWEHAVLWWNLRMTSPAFLFIPFLLTNFTFGSCWIRWQPSLHFPDDVTRVHNTSSLFLVTAGEISRFLCTLCFLMIRTLSDLYVAFLYHTPQAVVQLSWCTFSFFFVKLPVSLFTQVFFIANCLCLLILVHVLCSVISYCCNWICYIQFGAIVLIGHGFILCSLHRI